MFLQYFIILLSILCRATVQTTNVPLVNGADSTEVTDKTSESQPEGVINPTSESQPEEGTNPTSESQPEEGINSTSESPRATGLPEHPCRNGTEWQCTDKTCIDNYQKCDGVIHCQDASDETLGTCRNEKPRPLFGLILHCSSFWNHQHESVCPQICQKSPEFCYYALTAVNNQSNTCLLPDYPINGSYKIMPINQTETPGQVDFWLKFRCEPPYVMVQKRLLQCINGLWENDPTNNGYCSEACKLNKNSTFTYKCPLDVYNSTECGEFVAINTTVNVAHVNHDTDNPVKNISIDIQCTADKEFNISTDCVQKVDDMQQKFEKLTMVNMTKYESKFNLYNGNETNKDFDSLVKEYHKFETDVRENLTEMWKMAEQCDISLDFLLNDLQLKQDKTPKQETSPSSTELYNS